MILFRIPKFRTTRTDSFKNFQSFLCVSLVGKAAGASPRRSVRSMHGTKLSESNSVHYICSAIKSALPQSEVFLYGSHSYGLADDESDLNIYIAMGESQEHLLCMRVENYRSISGADDQSYKLQPPKTTLDERRGIVVLALSKEHWKNVTYAQRQVVLPLVRATSVDLGVNFTFSFGNGLFVEATHLIRDYLNALPMGKYFVHGSVCKWSFKEPNIIPPAQSMIRCLKKWQRGIEQNDTKMFDTYQISILVIWYFQLRRYLPWVKSLQDTNGKRLCGGRWRENFKESSKPPRKCVFLVNFRCSNRLR